MAEGVQSGLVQAVQVAREVAVRQAPNGVCYAAFGANEITDHDLERLVQAVPGVIAAALTRKAYYFVPLAMSEREHRTGSGEETMVSSVYSVALSDQAICHRNVELGSGEGIFISTRLLGDRFALAFELFINIGHAFVDAAGVPESFSEMVWVQAVADVRGETSVDAWESRNLAFAPGKERIDEKAKANYMESAFSDAVAIYLLSLAVDFDYAELREREYPLLAPQALAERLRHVAGLFPPNEGYEFAVRYRRRG